MICPTEEKKWRIPFEQSTMALTLKTAAALLAIFFLAPPCASQKDRLTTGTSLSTSQTLVSAGGSFALGFFSPGKNSTTNTTTKDNSHDRYYVGIWYNNIPEKTIVWVANRENPVKSSGVLSLLDGGNLAVVDGGIALWSTNISSNTNVTTLVKLWDTGNLVLTGESDDAVLWQSFDHPTDTLLPSMKLGISLDSGASRGLVSWRAPLDPSPGDASFSLDPDSPLQFLLRNGSEVLFRYGIWGAKKVGFIAGINSSVLLLDAMVVEDREIYYTYSVTDGAVHLRIHVANTGELKLSSWRRQQNRWTPVVNVPYLPSCNAYNKCGPFGTCNDSDGEASSWWECKCLKGFLPKSQREWEVGNFTSGCVRETPLNCSTGNDQHMFVKVTGIRLPDEFSFFRNKSAAECEGMCASSCNCSAYAYNNFSSWDVVDERCLVWHGELIDMAFDSLNAGELFVRLAASVEFNTHGDGFLKRRRHLLIIIPPVAAGLILLAATGCFLRKRLNKKGSRATSGIEVGTTGLPLIDFPSLSVATQNFSSANKLGEGGFGPVYKGELPNGKEIAVKRLSNRSGQGFQEFKNENQLIGKLQHKNLVRILGWCAYEDEKILVYEYLPNKSLDKFLFDPNHSAELDWSLRYQIIEGIAQGLLYLHRFSRPRIIHRDMKSSNILLDDAMNPKISDFGLARVFEGNEIEAETRRVVGTYGYMSPEYAMRGFFSEKSDVFSFGVIVIEIITGKRNSINDPNGDYLLEHAWKLWEDGRCLELVDPSIRNSIIEAEVAICVQAGLLCVQENASDRPAISSVLSMLSSEKADLPRPRQPAFAAMEYPNPSQSSLSADASNECSNNLTVSILEGR